MAVCLPISSHRWLLLLLWTRIPSTRAFANYLLSGGGCFTDLDPSEVIMNAAVVAADIVQPNYNMHIDMDGPLKSEHVLTEFPATLTLQVLGDKPPADYQWVLDVLDGAKAHFVNGQCEGKRRVSGRGASDAVQVVVEEPGAVIVAGWAAKHEAVKLVPSITFVQASKGANGAVSNQEKEPVVGEAAKEATQHEDWVALLLSEAGCSMEHVRDGTMNQLESYSITASDHELTGRIEGSLPAQLFLSWKGEAPSGYDRILLESSQGASFEHGHCGGQRLVLGAEGAWPPLTVHQQLDITVWALYSSPSATQLVRVRPLVVPQAHEDPQKGVDERIRVGDLHQQIRDHRAKLGRRSKGSAASEESTDHRGGAAAAKTGRHASSHARLPKSSSKKDSEPIRLPVRAHHHMLGPLHPAEDEHPSLGFTVGTSYFVGLAILVAGPILVIRLCLGASGRRRKGRKGIL